VTINALRNSGHTVGFYEVNMKDKDHKKSKYAKEKKVDISNLIQSRKSK
jgi:hypothetical protein